LAAIIGVTSVKLHLSWLTTGAANYRSSLV
jgi:hypothetical protein